MIDDTSSGLVDQAYALILKNSEGAAIAQGRYDTEDYFQDSAPLMTLPENIMTALGHSGEALSGFAGLMIDVTAEIFGTHGSAEIPESGTLEITLR